MSGYCAVKLPSRGVIHSKQQRRHAGHRQRAGAGRPRHALRGGGDAVEGGRDRRQQFGAMRCQLYPLAGALEQLDAERLLQRLDLVADGAMGDIQLARRLGQRAMARRRLEGAQRIQGRQALGHERSGLLCEIFSQTDTLTISIDFSMRLPDTCSSEQHQDVKSAGSQRDSDPAG